MKAPATKKERNIMQFDQSFVAKTIAADWPRMVGDLPKPLTDAIAVYEEAQWIEEPHPVVPTNLTAKNVGQAMADATQAFILRDRWFEGRNLVLDSLARNVLALAADAVPALIEKLTPEFDAAVAEYQAAVGLLPDDHSPAALIHAGGGAVDAYHRATEAEANLTRFQAWLNTLYGVPGHGYRREAVLLLLRPTTRAELQALLDSTGRGDLNATYLKAVELGIEWGLNTPAEAVAIAEEINAQPVIRKKPQFMSFA